MKDGTAFGDTQTSQSSDSGVGVVAGVVDEEDVSTACLAVAEPLVAANEKISELGESLQDAATELAAGQDLATLGEGPATSWTSWGDIFSDAAAQTGNQEVKTAMNAIGDNAYELSALSTTAFVEGDLASMSEFGNVSAELASSYEALAILCTE